MFKYAIMTIALLPSYPSHAMDFTELDRWIGEDIEAITTKITRSPSPRKGIAVWEKVQVEENEKEKSKK